MGEKCLPVTSAGSAESVAITPTAEEVRVRIEQ